MTNTTETKKRTRIVYPELDRVSCEKWRNHPRVEPTGYYKDRLADNADNPERLDSCTTVATLRLVAYNVLELRPTWTAQCGSSNSVIIFEDGQQLGDISSWYSRRSSEYGVEIDCDRIRHQSAGRRAKKTADVKAAIRLVLDNFFPKTNKELWTDSSLTASRYMQSLINAIDRKRDLANRQLRERAYQFAMTTAKGEFLQSLDEEGRKEYDAMETHAASLAIAQEMRDNKSKYTGVQVLENGSFIAKVNDEVVRLGPDQLPEAAANAYILKMTPEDEVIEGVGVKLDESILLVKLADPEPTESTP
jgi:hypothetical protein